jgi:hypothetical protein
MVALISQWIRRYRSGLRASVCALAAFGLSGCDQLGIETPVKAAEREHAAAKAVGGACRHAMRAIEDCYVLNPKADKSAVYDGWREMDEYMRENKLEGVVPVVPRPAPVSASAPKKAASAAEDAEEEDAPEDEAVDEDKDKKAKSGAKGGGKAAH